jgi:hypothetical protein
MILQTYFTCRVASARFNRHRFEQMQWCAGGLLDAMSRRDDTRLRLGANGSIVMVDQPGGSYDFQGEPIVLFPISHTA